MASNGFLLSSKVTDAATISGSATVSGGDVANVQTTDPDIPAIFSSTTPNIVWDCTTAKTFDAACIGFITCGSSTDTVRVRAATSEANLTAAPGYDSGSVTIWPVGSSSDLSAYARIHRILTFASQTYRWWRMDFSCAVAPSVGRAFIGARVQPALPVMWGWTPDFGEPVAATVSLSGRTSIRPMGGSKRTVRVEWGWLTRPEALKNIYRLLMERGSARDFAIVVDPDIGVVDYSAGVDHMPYTYIGTSGEASRIPNTFAMNHSVALVVTELAALGMS